MAVDFHEIKVLEGHTTTVDLTANDHPTMRVVYESGSFPDDQSPNQGFQFRLSRWEGFKRGEYIVSTASLPISKAGFAFFIRASAASDRYVASEVNKNIYAKIQGLPAHYTFAAPGAPSAEMKMHRLEIADAEVTLANGTTTHVPVKARISGEPDGWIGTGAFVLDGFVSGHGTNWPSGHYSVETVFIHPEDGTPVTKQEDVLLE